VNALIALAVRRPISTLMFFLGLIVVAVTAAAGFGVEFLPDVTVPRLIVSSSYPGLPASDVRVLMAIPLEDALSSAKGVKRISSVSREGMVIVTLDYHWGTDMKMAGVEAREIIDIAYASLPSDVRKPLVLPVDPDDEPVLIIGLFPRDGDLALARRLAEREIKTRLQQASGVGTVTLVGGQEEEIRVLVDQESLAARGLGISDVSGAIESANYDYPSGTIREGDIEFLVKAKGSVDAAWKIGEFPITAQPGSASFAVKDIAVIRTEPKERKSIFCQNGREGVALEIRKRPGFSPVDVVRSVSKELMSVQDAYGRDLDLVIERDTSRFVLESVEDLLMAVAIGVGIAFFLILIFMRDVRISLVMISSVPVSMLAALLLMKIFGRTINIMSLGGLAMGIGMMVDHSVVVVENLQRRFGLERRKVTQEAIIEFTCELSSSNVGSTLTSIIVFIPVLFLPGVIGALFTDLSLAVVFSQVSSFLASITLVPVLFLFASYGNGCAQEASSGFRRFERRFRSASRYFFRKPAILVSAITVLTLVGVVCIRFLPFEFMPDVDSGEVDATITLPQGSTMEYAAAVAADITSRISSIQGVELAYATCGGEDDDPYYQASPLESREIVHVKAVLSRRPRKSAFSAAEELRAALRSEGAPVVVSLPENSASRLLGAKNDKTEFVVFGKDQADAELKATALHDMIVAMLPGSAPSIAPSGAKQELRLIPDREALASGGKDLYSVARSVKEALDGSYPTRISAEGREIDVRVMLRDEQRLSRDDVGGIIIGAGSGNAEPLRSLAASSVVIERPALMRVDRRDAIKVTVPRGEGAGEAAIARSAAESGLDFRSLSQSALTENAGPIAATLALVLLLLYLTLGAQFESFGLPLVLLLSLPLSVSGIFGSLYITGKSINFDSILGIIVLFGVAVNNSVILYANYRKRGGEGRHGVSLVSIYRGTSERLRAIVITMSATILSMLPIALDLSRRTTQSSMAIAIIGGLLVSTTLTLFVVPIVFYRVLRPRR